VTGLAPHDPGGLGVGADVDPELLDPGPQRGGRGAVELCRHQPRRELDHRRCQTEVAQRVGRLEAEQPTTDDDAAVGPPSCVDDGVEVLDGAVDGDAGAGRSLDRRHEGVGPGGEHQLVVGHRPASAGHHRPCGSVDRRDLRADLERDLRIVVDLRFRQAERREIAAGDVGAQMHPVVGRSWLLTEHQDPQRLVEGDELPDELVSDHAVADDDHGPALVAGVQVAAAVGRRQWAGGLGFGRRIHGEHVRWRAFRSCYPNTAARCRSCRSSPRLGRARRGSRATAAPHSRNVGDHPR
jgi:hypothetical protein